MTKSRSQELSEQFTEQSQRCCNWLLPFMQNNPPKFPQMQKGARFNLDNCESVDSGSQRGNCELKDLDGERLRAGRPPLEGTSPLPRILMAELPTGEP